CLRVAGQGGALYRRPGLHRDCFRHLRLQACTAADLAAGLSNRTANSAEWAGGTTEAGYPQSLPLRGGRPHVYNPALMSASPASSIKLRHLLGIEGLSPETISALLDVSETYIEQNRQIDKKQSLLR